MNTTTLLIFDKSIFTVVAYQALIFAIILFIFSRKYARSKRILGYYMMLNFIYYLYNFFYYTGNFDISSKLYYIILPVVFLLQPFFYLYIKSLTSINFKCSPKQLLHFVPALIVLLMNIFLYSFLTYNEQIQLLSFNGETSNKILKYYLYLHNYGYHYILSVQALFYFGLIIFTIYKHKKEMSSNFSNTEGIKLDWLIALLLIFITISTIQEIIGNIDKVVYDPIARINYNLFYMFTISFIGIGGIIQKEIYGKNTSSNVCIDFTEDTDIKPETKYKNSSLNDEAKKILIIKLKKYIEQEKPYLNNDLKLHDISDALETNRQYLSQIINETYNQNFYTLINKLRIEEAKKMFFNKKHKQLSIMGVANTVGFNSKSTFNTLFKKYSGKTPSQFIKENNL